MQKLRSKQGKWTAIVLFYFFLIPCLCAEPLPPLIVATEIFNPPFIMQGSGKQLFGFDIEMMSSLCKIMHRTCEYHPIFSENTLLSLIDSQADVGVATITITAERDKKYIFSLPYLPSYVQFLGLKKWEAIPFTKQLLNGKKIGIQSGSILADAIDNLDLKNVSVIKYDSTAKLIYALTRRHVDLILQDAGTAQYWANQMPSFTTVGKPFIYGYGFAIVINKNKPELLSKINDALIEYQKGGFQENYNRYLLNLTPGYTP